MNEKISDSIKDLIPDTKIFKVPDIQPKIDYSVFESHLPDIDPDSLAPNRTANGVEQMVEILQNMSSKIDEVEQSQVVMKEQISTIQEESRSTDSQNRNLTYILIGIGVLTLLATIVGLYV